MKDETLVEIAKELVEIINKNMTIDWDIRRDAKARMRFEIKRLLNKYGYPPVKRDSAVQLVIKQAELKCKNMIEEQEKYMESNNSMNLFSNEDINRYSKYFDLPKVIDQANKIEEIVKNGKEMSFDESMASICLAFLKIKQVNGGKNE